jgi:hypothetical protein
LLEVARDKTVFKCDEAVEKLEESEGAIKEHDNAIEKVKVECDYAIKEKMRSLLDMSRCIWMHQG